MLNAIISPKPPIGAGPTSLSRSRARRRLTPPKGPPALHPSTRNPSHFVSQARNLVPEPALRSAHRLSCCQALAVQPDDQRCALLGHRRAQFGLSRPPQGRQARPQTVSEMAWPLASRSPGAIRQSRRLINAVALRCWRATRLRAARAGACSTRSRHLCRQGSKIVLGIKNVWKDGEFALRSLKFQTPPAFEQSVDHWGTAADEGFGFKMFESLCQVTHSLPSAAVVKIGVDHQLPQMFFHGAAMRRSDLPKTLLGPFGQVPHGQACHVNCSNSISMQSMYAMKAL